MNQYMLTACPHCNAVRVEVAVIPVFRPPNRGQLTNGSLFDWSPCKPCQQCLDEMEQEHRQAVRDLEGLNKTIAEARDGTSAT